MLFRWTSWNVGLLQEAGKLFEETEAQLSLLRDLCQLRSCCTSLLVDKRLKSFFMASPVRGPKPVLSANSNADNCKESRCETTR